MSALLTWVRDRLAAVLRWLFSIASEDDEGKTGSSTRVIGLILASSAASLTGTLDFYVAYQVVHARTMDATMITALAGVITALLSGSAWAIYRRSGSGGSGV